MSKDNELKKTLGLFTAVGLAITMVVGSGLLILPGLAYQKVGSAAIYAWGISALISIPLLIVFARLGAEIPGAGGVAGFMQAAFSRREGAATEILILGTIPGGAAIAITGGKYLRALFDGNLGLEILGCFSIFLVGGTVNYLGGKVSGKIQQVLAFILVALLLVVAVASFALGDTSAGQGITPFIQALDSMPAVGLVFFAFVGWELMSFTTEEFKNPKRDFPLMVALSFLIVVVLYILVAVAIQLVLPRSHPEISTTPIAAMLATVIGKLGSRFISVLGVLIVVANFISVVWAFSRLSFSSAREGLLPSALAHTQTDAKIPRNAVIVCILGFGAVALMHYVGLVSQSLLFELAGISFFMSYALAVAAYIKRASQIPAKMFGIGTFVGVSLVFINFGATIIYPIALYALGLLIHQISANRRRKGVTEHV
jgi:amino acid efflux transporter